MTPAARRRKRAAVGAFAQAIYAVRHVLAASALALAGLIAFGTLAPLAGAALFVVVSAAALWGTHAEAERRRRLAAASLGDATAADAPPEAIAELIEAMPEAIVVLDAEGRVVAANARASALAPALRRGEPALLALRMPAVVDAVRRAVASGQAQRAEFSERVPLDRWFAVHVTPAASADARRRLYVLAFQDLTPLRQVEEMRADFVANASHELRTPLAALSGFIDTLQGPARDDPEARDKFLAIMREQARRMARLIDDLLSLSRIELAAHIVPDKVVDVAPLLRQVVDGLQVLARERQVDVALTGPASAPVRGERDELIRVFENLIENGLKYGGAGKRLDIELSVVSSPAGRCETRVAIRDYGPGIAPEHLPRLTERFYRVDVGHSRAEGGTGLGLALVKHILNRHRGRLSIESGLGAGSTFTVYLPAVEEGDRKAGGATPPASCSTREE